MDLLTVKDLSFQKEGYFAFKHVAFSLSQNQAIGITGDNGAGKTALLETIAGFNFPDSGSVEQAPKTSLSFMPQIETQDIADTVIDHLELERQLAGDLGVSSDQLKDLAGFMGMTPYFDRPVNSLSIGLKQRISFLDAVSKRPNILVLDDPFSFQTSAFARNMVEIFKDLQDHGSGIIVADPMKDNILEEYFDQKYVLDKKYLVPYKKDRMAGYILGFRATEDSMAITKELANYVMGTFEGMIEMKVPYNQKEHVLKSMLEMNYLFEGMENLEI